MKLYTHKEIEWIPHISDDIIFYAIFIDSMKCHPLQFYDVKLPLIVQRSVPKRQYEFLAGRMCAQAVCMQLNSSNIAIDQDLQGRPVWPVEIVGSITHTSEIAVAAASCNNKIKNIGIDSESLIYSDSVISSIQNLVLCKSEKKLVEREEDFILMFSVKEALYKCLNPIINQSFDFKDIQVIEIDRQNNFAYLKFCSSNKFKGDLFRAYFSFDSVYQHVHSCIILK